MGSIPTERKPPSVSDPSPELLSNPFHQILCRGDSSRWSSIPSRLMKRGQQTCQEPKCRRCILITGNRNMSALMSACFYLEMKMHLCCPDPFFWSFQSRNGKATHTHTPQMLRVPFSNRKSYHLWAHRSYLCVKAENQPQVSPTDSSPCVEKGGKGWGGICLWEMRGSACASGSEMNILCTSPLTKVHWSWSKWNPPPPPSSLSQLQRSSWYVGLRIGHVHRH